MRLRFEHGAEFSSWFSGMGDQLDRANGDEVLDVVRSSGVLRFGPDQSRSSEIAVGVAIGYEPADDV